MGTLRTGSPARLALTFLLAVAATGTGCRARAKPKNVVLITIDTTRADHLGCYGYAAAHTPTLDGLAADGALFEEAYSSVPLTAPSHSTIMTGKHPMAHGVRDNGLFILQPDQHTLAEILKERGYRTAAAVGGFPLVVRYGLNQGFDLYDDKLTPGYDSPLAGPAKQATNFAFEERPAARVNDAVFDWIDTQGKDPFFLWVHYYDPHQPLKPPVPYDQLFAGNLYDGEIAYADESLGALLERIKRKGLYKDTVVVMASDHGEGLGDHEEMTHSYLLYNSTLHVPLIVRGPGVPAGTRVHGRVRLLDILPTVLELLGVPIPNDVQGRSLVPLFAAGKGGAAVERTHYAETLSPRLSQNWGELRALYEDHWKYVHGPRPELFDLAADPKEMHNLAAERPEQAEAMRSRLADFLARNSPPGVHRMTTVDEETRARLQALGYLAAGAGQGQEIREELRSDGLAPQDRAGDMSMVGQARSFLSAGDPWAARDVAQRLLIGAPDDPFYLEILATAEVQLERPDAALPAVEKMLKQGPANDRSAEQLLLSIGRMLDARGDHAAGLRLVRRSLELEPSAAGYHLLATLQAGLGHAAEERQSLERALALDPKYAPARLDLAVRLAQEGRRSDARRELDRVVAEQPYLAKAQYNYGAFLLEEGQTAEALARFDRAVLLDPDYARARYAGIAVRLTLGRRAEAEKAVAELEAHAPGSEEARKARRLLEETPS
jgi:arylsulfatase A-like enzyme/Flp pilus assembly protein TadD